MLIQTIEIQDQTYQIKIGKSAQENWDLISSSNQNDIWFHLKSFPSPHVVLVDPPLHPFPPKLLQTCAALCKQHSKYKNLPSIKVIYTKIKYVKKATKVGSVTTSKTSELTID